MSLKFRLLLVTGAVLLVAFVGITWINVRTFRNIYVENLRGQGLNLTKLLREQARGQLAMTDGDLESLSRFALSLREIGDGLSGVLETMIVDREGQILAHASVERIGSVVEPKPGTLDISGDRGRLVELPDRLSLFIPLRGADDAAAAAAFVRVDFDGAEVGRTISGITAKAFLVAFVGLVAVFLMNIWFYGRNIGAPIAQIRDTFGHLGEGNLAAPIPEFRDQEFQLAARALSAMSGGFREIIQRVTSLSASLHEATDALGREFALLDREAKRISGNLDQSQQILDTLRQEVRTVNEQVDEVFLMAQETSSSILEIKGSIEEVDENTGRLHRTLDSTLERLGKITGDMQKVAERNRRVEGDTDNLASAVSELAASIAEVGANAAQNLGTARQAKLQAQEGVAAVTSTVDEMQNIRDAVRHVDDRARALLENSEKIEGILRIIHQVAEKTNLLALNASIIAAQAGEHGFQFREVAKEISELSDKVRQSTKEIGELIQSVQRETEAVSSTARDALDKVERGEAQVSEAKEKLERILTASTDSEQMSQAIARAMDEQATVSSSIADVTTKIQQLVHDVARATITQADQARELNLESRQVADLSTVVKKAIQEETEGARRVAESVDRIMRNIKHISDATERQTGNAEQIAGNTAENVVALQEAVRMISSFQARIEGLAEEAERLDKLLTTFRA